MAETGLVDAVTDARRDVDRDRFMSAQEAVEYGLIDEVIEHR